MGKRIIAQARGKGSPTYRAHSFRWLADVKHRAYDGNEKTSSMPGKIVDILHSSGHSAPIAKVQYENGETGYIFAPLNVRVNDVVAAGFNASIKPGNTLPLIKIPEGTEIYNVECKPSDGGVFARASGVTAKVISSSPDGVIVMLPSKKEKKFDPMCRATVGVIAGSGRTEKPFVKAGKRHHLMRARGKLYPRTSGVAMNAVDHPFGCGRGRHVGKPKTPSRFAPPGRKVGLIGAHRTGRTKK